MMGTVYSRDEMEKRRLRAARALQAGEIRQADIPRKFHVSRTTASRWNRVVRTVGLDGLRKHPAPGRPCRLSEDELRVAALIYRNGPKAAGFACGRWTSVTFTRAIQKRFGVVYNPDHVGRIIHKLEGLA
jgi:transposase